MKTPALPLAALALALPAFAADEPAPEARPQIEVCFVLDTTGSMGGLIEGAKQKIWSIANEVIAARPTPEVKFALVGYRDRGDDYVTRVTALTDDIDAVYAELQKFEAGGGGDTPESVSQALHEAVSDIAWSRSRDVLKIIYLVGDAPPHTDYPDGPDYREVCATAARSDLIINTVQCGTLAGTREVWQEIASAAEGRFIALEQSGNMVVVATPFDEDLSELNRQIGATLVPFGSNAARAGVVAKQALAESVSAPAAADRLRYNSVSRKAVQGEGELIDALGAGKVELADLKRDELPEEWRELDDEAREAKVKDLRSQREAIQQKIATLSQQRENFLAAERKRLAESGKADDAFDTTVAESLKEQAARKGIRYQ